MKKPPLFFVLLLTGAGTTVSFAASENESARALPFFESRVRPVLINRCFECHGEKKQKGGLRIDSLAALLRGGDNGPALIPGNPDKSPLIEAIRYANTDFQMPPSEKLPESEIRVLEQWIEMGAPWPQAGKAAVVLDENGFSAEQKAFWCFQPLGDAKPPRATPPKVQGTNLRPEWTRSDIDHFIAQKHQELGLTAAREADRNELLRRLTMDLHGLPPSREQAESFLKDTRSDAYERLVDSLLANPHYGERWAQHWLDLVRYAESDGYNADEFRPSAWPYRDYVIQSLNSDKPYNTFVREQIAGDEITPHDPAALTATGYLRTPIYEWNQADVRGQWEIILTDITDTTGELFLGLSFGCARCHNHKFDPILQKDYFRLRAFFEPLQWRDDLKTGSPEEKEAFAGQQTQWESATAQIRAQMALMIEPLMKKSVERALKRFNEELQAMVRKAPAEREPVERQLVNLCERQLSRARRTLDPLKSLKADEEKVRYTALAEELKKFDSLKPKPLMEAFVATDVGPVAPATLLKTRKGETPVAPGFLTLLQPGDAAIPNLNGTTGRRTALAAWITSPDNPLTARVIVNRIWQYHFGRGLVATSSDFGKLGEFPSHPELLDWMARRFIENGWSLKKLHKEILLSATYRQTSRREPGELELRVDPNNRMLWRFHPRRLDAEQVRDAMLATSGELNLKQGGPPEDGTGTRRSIYTIKKRNSQNELLRSLDAPAGFSSTPERQSTTTPTQALFMLNSEWPLQRAQKLAARVRSIEDAWQVVYGRSPTPSEQSLAQAFLQKLSHGTPSPDPASQPSTLSKIFNETPGTFREKTSQERLIAQKPVQEGDEFTVETVFKLASIDSAAAVRTLVSRWAGAKDNIEAYGWSLGVTGEKSRFKPLNLIVQLVGEDENANTAYEVAASNLRIDLDKRYHAVVHLSCADHAIEFRLRNLDNPGSPVQTARIPIVVRSKLGQGTSGLTVGGLSKRAPAHQWDGCIEALRVVSGRLNEKDSSPDASLWKSALVQWIAQDGSRGDWSWNGEGKGTSESADAHTRAMTDLCQILLNSSEFLYLH